MREPKRLIDEPGLAPTLREALDEARKQAPSAEQAGAIASSLGPVAAAPVVVSSASAIGPLLIKAALIAALGAGAGTVWFIAHRAAPTPLLRSAAPGVATLSAHELEPPPAPAASVETIDLDADAVSPAPSAGSRVAPAASVPAPSEATLLEQARQNLASNPARALALTEEHRRRYPNGVLAQEREVIAIDALGRMGKADEAKRRTDSFDKDNPDTIHRRTVKQPAQ